MAGVSCKNVSSESCLKRRVGDVGPRDVGATSGFQVHFRAVVVGPLVRIMGRTTIQSRSLSPKIDLGFCFRLLINAPPFSV
jgi:hypothetical protein